MDTSQWEFYVVPMATIKSTGYKSIGLVTLTNTEMETLPAFKMGYSGENGSWQIVVMAAEDDVISTQSLLNQNIPEKRRDEVALLAARINWNLRMGAFKIDMTDGEVRYVHAFDAEGIDLPPSTFSNLLYSNVMITDKYFSAFMAVAYAGVDSFSALLNLED